VQRTDDGYSILGNIGGSLVRNMVSIYFSDGTNVYGSRCGEFEKIKFKIGSM